MKSTSLITGLSLATFVEESFMETTAPLLGILEDLAEMIVGDFDVVELLTQLTERCVEILNGTETGIMLARGGDDLEVMASSSEDMRVLDLLESQAQEGPCIECYHLGTRVMIEDVMEFRRQWPLFVAECYEVGFQSAHTIPMKLRGLTIGVLSVYRAEKGPLSTFELSVAQILADLATLAVFLHGSKLDSFAVERQLHRALDCRVVVEQAKGMLTELADVNVDVTFSMMRDYARRHGIPFIEVAQSTADGSLATELIAGPDVGSDYWS
jgi:hypothetical protein